jgi:hypothetical protein
MYTLSNAPHAETILETLPDEMFVRRLRESRAHLAVRRSSGIIVVRRAHALTTKFLSDDSTSCGAVFET